MNTAYLLIGGNMGNRSDYLRQARDLVGERCGQILQSSALYETAAWGVIDQPAFYNQAVTISTSLDPETLMRELLQIEESMGRKRVVKMGPRIIDLDILLVDDHIISTGLLTLPHPSLPQRRFALLPLAEIAPELVHPVLHKTISQLLAECRDELDVQKKSGDAD
jgi:2-amino-4-hydroxy-6-hydroxymethyldihydropteridine diphosphokinase